MAERTLYAFQRAFEDADTVLGIRFDGGRWEVASREKRTGRSVAMPIGPEAMDQLVAAWPAARKAVEA